MSERFRKYLIIAVGIFTLLGCDHILPAFEYNPVGNMWSPDSRYVVFSYNEQVDNSSSCIYRLDVQTGEVKQLTFPPDCKTNHQSNAAATWSPTESQIAFNATRYEDSEYRKQIFVMDGDGNQIRPLFDTATNGNPSWSSDGRHIAFIDYDDTRCNLALADKNGENLRSIGSDDPTNLFVYGCWIPSWSLDSQYIFDGYNFIEVATGEAHRPTQSTNFLMDDGTFQEIELELIMLDSVWLYDNSLAYLGFQFIEPPKTLNGFHVTLSSGFFSNYLVYRADMDGENLRRVNYQDGVISIGASKDGKLLAFYNDRLHCIFIYDAVTEENRQLQWEVPQNPHWQNPILAWSPDNEYLLFGDATLLAIIDVDTGEMTSGVISRFNNLSDSDEDNFTKLKAKRSVWDNYFLIGCLFFFSALLIKVLWDKRRTKIRKQQSAGNIIQP